MTLTRRSVNKGLGATLGLASLAAPSILRAQSQGRVVVIGGGAGGGTVAKHLAQDSKGALEVTLVQESATYTTCFFSNLFLGGLRDFDSITHGYDVMAEKHGVKPIFQRATEADTTAKRVTLADGTTLDYDVLVVAPGIRILYDSIEGYSKAAAEIMPHAWQAGPQTQLLKRQLEAMDDGGLFVIAVPTTPYRCPPAPYERVSLIAHYFKQTKPNSKILILDAKDAFAKQALFQEAWLTFYEDMVEWVPGEFGGRVEAVDTTAMTLTGDGDTHEADVANVIPAQAAGAIAEAAGLTDDSGWCPIVPATMASRQAADVYVVGDACDPGEMPKAASSAHSQALAAVAAIRHQLTGAEPPSPHYSSACWSTLAPDDAVKVSGTYRPTEETIEKVETHISAVGEAAELRHETWLEAESWYAAITADIFG